MDPERWKRLRALFDSASRLDPREVDGFLDLECGKDAALREELQSLVNQVSEAEDPLADAVQTTAREIVGAVDSRPLAIGDSIGKYRIAEELGGGGMGTVYAAEDSELDRKVALKVLAPSAVPDAGRLQRFRREARALARLSHPNIVTIYSVEHDDNRYFLTMELVRGRPLAEAVSDSGFDLERFFAIAIPLCGALAAAHEHGVTHRDLKPANVMLGEDDAVKILDFGLAKLRHGEAENGETAGRSARLTQTGLIMGTIPYMSPEQVEGKPLGPRSDIFSLGVILYELACGSRPFRGESSALLTAAILTREPPSLAGLRPDLPLRLGQIIGRCLEKNPEQRYQDAEALRRDLAVLQAAVRLHPRLSHALSGLTALLPRTRRQRITVAAAAALIAILSTALLKLDSGWVSGAAPVEKPEIRSVAVLPFLNLSEDEGQEYLADGMTVLLITELSRLGAVKVISRTSVMRFKGSVQPLGEIARELGIDAVVEGSVMRSGDQVRVTANLVHADSDVHLWADSYERGLQDILMLQSTVARSIAQEIGSTLTPRQQARLAALGEVSPSAAEAYFKGLDGQGDEYFERAIAEEPEFARAHAALARSLAIQGWMGWPYPPREAYRRARQSAARALEIDPDLSEAHAAEGRIAFYFDWDWEAAERELRHAIELDPGNADARDQLASFLAAMGRLDEALTESERARDLDPLSVDANAALCRRLYHARQFNRALNQLHRHFDPLSTSVHGMRWKLLAALGEAELGANSHLLAEQLAGASAPQVAGWREALAASGPAGYWRRWLEDTKRTPEQLVQAVLVAQGHTILEEYEEALFWLEAAYEHRRPRMTFLGVDPIWDPLRSDRRFNDLLVQMNLPQAVRPEGRERRGSIRRRTPKPRR